MEKIEAEENWEDEINTMFTQGFKVIAEDNKIYWIRD